MQNLWPHAYVHALNPFVLKFTDTFGIRWYGLAYLGGFTIGYLTTWWLAKKNLTVVKPEQVGDLVFCTAVGTVIGGRLGYCLFYAPHLFTQITSSPPYWGLLAVNQGGMASHGGILGLVLGCLWFSRTRKLPFLALCDLTTIGGTLGIFFGRVANFINGELVGRPAPPGFPLAVKFPEDILFWPAQEPTRLISLTPVVEKLGISPPQWDTIIGTRFSDPTKLDEILYRIVGKIQTGDTALKDQLAPLLTGRYPSQLYEALLEGIFLFCVLMFIWRKPRKPGIVGGWFLLLYPIVRIFCEQYRMPDPGIGFQWLGLTRGQWLSIVMIVLTSWLVYFFSRRNEPAIGGWLPHDNTEGNS